MQDSKLTGLLPDIFSNIPGFAFPAVEPAGHYLLTLHHKLGKILRNAKSTPSWVLAALELEFARHSGIVCIEIVEGARLVPLRRSRLQGHAGLGFSVRCSSLVHR